MQRPLCLCLTFLSLTAISQAKDAPIVSPVFEDTGAITFRVAAPKAESVNIAGEMLDSRVALKKGEKGVWAVTFDDLKPGLYGYSFYLDGVQMLDPGNPQLKPMRSPKTSVLHIPDPAPGAKVPFDFHPDIPHGTLHQHGYFSSAIQRYRELRVYTPPGYETGTESYPLLVLQHGHSDGGATWTSYGKAHWILDFLISEGSAVPMIVIMLDGHPIPESFGDGRSDANTQELRDDLMKEALPLTEKLYRVKAGRENRAITGLSMGGLHSISIGLNELGTFSSIGSFSGAMPDDAVVSAALKSPAETNQALDLFWIACGKDDFLLDENREMLEKLEAAGIDHEWHLTEGSHAWPIWRGYLADFAPRLFQD